MSVFLINVVKLCLPLSKLDLPTLRKGSTEERTQRNKEKSDTRWESNQVNDFYNADAIATKTRVPVAGPEFLSI